MKNLLLVLSLTLSLMSFAGSSYKIDEQTLNTQFENGTEVTFEEMYAGDIARLEASYAKNDHEVTLGGYLVRCFFCGGIALHRYYAGTDKGAMWALYCCVPILGGIAQLVDFWWVVFDEDALEKYKNNDSYLVWID